jgi:hypothetical protein
VRRALWFLALAGCVAKLDFSGTAYRCDDGTSCPPRYQCRAGMCLPAGADASAGLGDGAPDAIVTGADADLPVGYRETVLADQPLVYLRLDDGGGVASDSSGNERHGSYAGGVTPVASGALTEMNGAALFDGVDGEVVVPDDAGLRLDGDFTIEVWVRLATLVHTYPGILFKGDAEPSGTGYIIYYPTAFPEVVFKRAGVDLRGTEGALTTPDDFRHYVLTYDREAMTLRWYVDGALNIAYIAIDYAPNLDATDLHIGRGDEYGNQTLDEFAVYDAALSEARIAAHFQAGRPAPP